MGLERLSRRAKCPNHASFRLLTVARSGSCGPTRKLILLHTQSLVRDAEKFPQELRFETVKAMLGLNTTHQITGISPRHTAEHVIFQQKKKKIQEKKIGEKMKLNETDGKWNLKSKISGNRQSMQSYILSYFRLKSGSTDSSTFSATTMSPQRPTAG